MMHRGQFEQWVLCLALLTGLSVAPDGALASEAEASNWWQDSRLTIGGRYGDTQEFVIDAFAPLWQPGDSRLILNLRGTFLEADRRGIEQIARHLNLPNTLGRSDEQEFSAGLVARHLFRDADMIIGVNAFYDTRWTVEDNTFNQVGAGIEWLSRWVDVRANVYYPLTDERVLEERTETRETVNDGVRVTETIRSRTYEEALRGYDVEAGVWLPYVSRHVPTGLFAGYHEFSSDYVDDFRGWRIRLESRLHPNWTLDAEWHDDDALSGSSYFVGVRIHIPLDVWNGIGFDRWAEDRSRIRSFDRRLGDMVMRDFRIRTINTGPVEVGRTRTEEPVAGAAPPPAGPAPSTPPPPAAPPPPPPEPDCREVLIGWTDEAEPIFAIICD